ncbi:hypothetical protein HanIR_Chr02g0056411 [Helianthus annuus]|nr:hypothetical protein HanIR_Chr02g0056411 [Helianthus annuus]
MNYCNRHFVLNISLFDFGQACQSTPFNYQIYLCYYYYFGETAIESVLIIPR